MLSDKLVNRRLHRPAADQRRTVAKGAATGALASVAQGATSIAAPCAAVGDVGGTTAGVVTETPHLPDPSTALLGDRLSAISSSSSFAIGLVARGWGQSDTVEIIERDMSEA